jgi:hypothetical protein
MFDVFDMVAGLRLNGVRGIQNGLAIIIAALIPG